jgi:hypothetical protein
MIGDRAIAREDRVVDKIQSTKNAAGTLGATHETASEATRQPDNRTLETGQAPLVNRALQGPEGGPAYAIDSVTPVLATSPIPAGPKEIAEAATMIEAVTVDIPMVEGAKIDTGLQTFTVGKGLMVRMTLRQDLDGNVIPGSTGLRIVDLRGRQAKLEGCPLFWADLRKIEIHDGVLVPELTNTPAWVERNFLQLEELTRQLFGQDRVPTDATLLVQRMLEKLQTQEGAQALFGAMLGATLGNDLDIQGALVAPKSRAAPPGRGGALVAPNGDSLFQEFSETLEFDALTFYATPLQGGRMPRLVPGTYSLVEGAEIQVRGGQVRELSGSLRGVEAQLEMELGPTRLGGGEPQVRLDGGTVEAALTLDRDFGKPGHATHLLTFAFDNPSLHGFSAQWVAGKSGRTASIEAEQIRDTDPHNAALTLALTPRGDNPSVSLDMVGLEAGGLRATLPVPGADGKPAWVSLGDTDGSSTVTVNRLGISHPQRAAEVDVVSDAPIVWQTPLSVGSKKQGVTIGAGSRLTGTSHLQASPAGIRLESVGGPLHIDGKKIDVAWQADMGGVSADDVAVTGQIERIVNWGSERSAAMKVRAEGDLAVRGSSSLPGGLTIDASMRPEVLSAVLAIQGNTGKLDVQGGPKGDPDMFGLGIGFELPLP